MGTVTVAVATLSLADASRPPEQQLSVAGAHAGIWMYQHTLSIAIQAFGISCRFTPTCSRYAHAVLSGYGWLRGTQLAAYRLAGADPGLREARSSHSPALARIRWIRPLLNRNKNLHPGGRGVGWGDVESKTRTMSNPRRHHQLQLMREQSGAAAGAGTAAVEPHLATAPTHRTRMSE